MEKLTRNRRSLRRKVFRVLASKDLDRAIDELQHLPSRYVINPLFSFLPSTDPAIKWAAVTAMGDIVAKLADQDIEQARVIVRRLMWQLNDESGGIGWGCTEAMGEIMACHEGLAKEYAQILISYVRKDGSFLEYEPLQRGAVWGIARVAQVRPHLVSGAIPHLLPFIQARDAPLRGLAVWALGLLSAQEARSQIELLANDSTEVEVYIDRQTRRCRVMDLANQALNRITQDQE